MPEHENDLRRLHTELQRSYWAEPTHLEAAPIVAEEVNRLAQHPTMLETPHVIEYMKPNVIGEVIEETNESLRPTKEVHVTAHKTQVATGDLEPFGYRVLAMRGGRRLEGSIIASVSYDDQGGRLELIRDEKGSAGMATITGDGKVLRSIDIKGHSTKLRAGLGDVVVTHQPNAAKKWTIEYQSDRENERGAQLKVAENVTLRSRADELKEMQSNERREKRKKWLKRAIGAGALYFTLVPGGVIDSVADQFTGTEQTVEAAIEIYEPNSLYTLDSEIDGIFIKDMSDPQATLAELNRQALAEWERTQAAGDAVNTSLNKLDEHNYQAILDSAMEYRDAHKNEFMDSDASAELFQLLESAQTKQEVLDALQPLGAFYGYEFVASDSIAFDALQNTAVQVADGLIILPKNFTDKAVLESIHFETPEEINEGSPDSRAAYYSPSNKAIHLGSSNAFMSTLKDMTSTMPGAAGGFDAQSIFLHEFAHALSDGTGKVGVADYERVDGAGTAPTIIEDIFLGGILSSPQVISNYARSSGEESLAENLSGILSDRQDGLAHPDRVRTFMSPANQTMIRGLVSLEMADPGFANYLIAQNDNLMHGQSLGTQ